MINYAPKLFKPFIISDRQTYPALTKTRLDVSPYYTQGRIRLCHLQLNKGSANILSVETNAEGLEELNTMVFPQTLSADALSIPLWFDCDANSFKYLDIVNDTGVGILMGHLWSGIWYPNNSLSEHYPKLNAVPFIQSTPFGGKLITATDKTVLSFICPNFNNALYLTHMITARAPDNNVWGFLGDGTDSYSSFTLPTGSAGINKVTIPLHLILRPGNLYTLTYQGNTTIHATLFGFGQ